MYQRCECCTKWRRQTTIWQPDIKSDCQREGGYEVKWPHSFKHLQTWRNKACSPVAANLYFSDLLTVITFVLLFTFSFSVIPFVLLFTFSFSAIPVLSFIDHSFNTLTHVPISRFAIVTSGNTEEMLPVFEEKTEDREREPVIVATKMTESSIWHKFPHFSMAGQAYRSRKTTQIYSTPRTIYFDDEPRLNKNYVNFHPTQR